MQVAWTKWIARHRVLQKGIVIDVPPFAKYVRGYNGRQLASKCVRNVIVTSVNKQSCNVVLQLAGDLRLQIQSVYRRYVCETKYKEILPQHRAAAKIQRQFRAYHTRKVIFIKILGTRKRLRSAIDING